MGKKQAWRRTVTKEAAALKAVKREEEGEALQEKLPQEPYATEQPLYRTPQRLPLGASPAAMQPFKRHKM